MRQDYIFPSLEPVRKKPRIFPIFLPFSGCPQRCVFCAQEVQTGSVRTSVSLALERAGKALEKIREEMACGEDSPEGRAREPLELAFFGGTFTALPAGDLEACLDFAACWQDRGVVGRLRCSTRPDALSPILLSRLGKAGFTCVELGVQSFSDRALAASCRGYDGETARRGCALVAAMGGESGISLGIQLLPGLPGHSMDDALADVETSIGLTPACVRLYPCLVLEGTELAALWRKGGYRPWEFEPTVGFLSRACAQFQKAGIAVIRMGLAEEPGLERHVLAGPRHPALGAMVRARALYAYVAEQVGHFLAGEGGAGLHAGGGGYISLHVPKRFQGEFWGHRGELVSAYAELGISRKNVFWRDEESFMLSGSDTL